MAMRRAMARHDWCKAIVASLARSWPCPNWVPSRAPDVNRPSPKPLHVTRAVEEATRLLRLLEPPADVIIASPPYNSGVVSKGGDIDLSKAYRQPGKHGQHTSEWQHYGQHPAQLGNLPPGSVADAIVSSPPYANGCTHTGGADPQPQHIQGGPLQYVAYGEDPAQLGGLPAGSVADAIVSSPPYAAISMNDNTPTINTPPRPGDVRQYQRKAPIREYGAQPGQLAALPTGAVEAVVSSPPYEASLNSDKAREVRPTDNEGIDKRCWGTMANGANSATRYGTAPQQLGNTQGTTFWEAAKSILEQTFCRSSPRRRGHLGGEIILQGRPNR